jgi:heat shock protein beta
MRFNSAIYGIAALIALNSKNNGFSLAEEEPVEKEEPKVEPYAFPDDSTPYEFEADVSRMLDIVVNSLYQNKDVFLRELISNAQDAMDKVRFLSIENPAILEGKEELEVKISSEPEEKTVTFTDSGIGMTKEELVNNLGTVARSGTSNFLSALQDGSANMDMIGQFGVGFYSTFLVADRVKVASKSANDPVQHVWESKNGDSSFHLYDDPRGNTLGRGTEITLYLKEDAIEYCDENKIEELAQYYSEFLTHPINVMRTETHSVPKEKPEVEEDSEEDAEEKSEDDLEMKDDDDEDEPEMEEVTTKTWKQVNTNKPIWARSKDEVTDKEYQEFWKHLSKDSYSEAAAWNHFNAEGSINFKSLVYLPPKLPTDYLGTMESQPNEMKLYVKKVLISDEFELLPRYLGFIKGVVDSDDLPLNVNRETLQESKIIRIIKKKLVRKVIEMIRKLSEKKVEEKSKEVELDEEGNVIEKPKKPKLISDDPDNLIQPIGGDDDDDDDEQMTYTKWYKEFGSTLKMGIIEDTANREKLMKLLRFKTSKFKDDDDWVSLEEYNERAPEWQDQIYYIPGDNIDQIDQSSFLDKFKSKDVEVLYLNHPIDEYMISNAPEYSGKKFQSITKTGVKIKDEDEDLIKRREKAYEKKFKVLTTYLKKLFGDNIFKVQVSKRLEDAPAMISSEEFGYSANMERLLKSQARAGEVDGFQYKSYRIFELNPRHPFMTELLDMVTPPVDEDEDSFEPGSAASDYAWLIHDNAVLKSGYSIQEVPEYTERLTRMLQSQMGIDSIQLEEEINPPVEEDDPDDLDEDGEGLNAGDFQDIEDMNFDNIDI